MYVRSEGGNLGGPVGVGGAPGGPGAGPIFVGKGIAIGVAKLLALFAKLLAPKLLAAGMSAVLDGRCFGGVSTQS